MEDYMSKRKSLPWRIRNSLDHSVKNSVLPEEWMGEFFQTVPGSAVVGPSPFLADVGILTIIPPEARMVRRELRIDDDVEPLVIGDDRYWTATVPSKCSKQALKVILTMVGEQRNAECASAVTRLRANFRVKGCILIGICAGVKAKVQLGGVIVASHVIDYEGARLEVDGKKKRHEMHLPPRSARADWQHANAARKPDENLENAWRDLPESFIPNDLDPDQYHPKIHTGIIATGEKLIVDGSLNSMREDLDERIVGADMESHGFAVGNDYSPVVKWMVFRGVSDYGEPKDHAQDRADKGDEWQHLASMNAAIVGIDFLRTAYRVPVSDDF